MERLYSSFTSWFTHPTPPPVNAEREQTGIRRRRRPTDAIVCLEQNDPTLTELEFNGDWISLGERIGDRGASALAKALAQNTTLLELRVWCNKLGEAGASALAEALKTNSSLLILNLRVNNLGDAGASALAEALKVNTSLKKLDLGKNKIGEAGASALVEALKVNSSLSELWLDGNKIGEAGASALAEMLKVNRSLSILDIDITSGNLLEDIDSLLQRNYDFAPQLKPANQSCRDGQAHLAAQRYPEARQCFECALKIYPEHPAAQAGLNNIPLLYNAIIRLQQNDPTLTELSLAAADLGDKEIAELAKALAKNTTLTSLNLSGNQITDAGAHVLAEALKTNDTLPGG